MSAKKPFITRVVEQFFNVLKGKEQPFSRKRSLQMESLEPREMLSVDPISGLHDEFSDSSIIVDPVGGSMPGSPMSIQTTSETAQQTPTVWIGEIVHATEGGPNGSIRAYRDITHSDLTIR